MNHAQTLRFSLQSLDVNEDFTEAVLGLDDESRLCFCHRVGERWAKAVGAAGNEKDGGKAEVMLAAVTTFRLNARHLEIEFDDESRWESRGTP